MFHQRILSLVLLLLVRWNFGNNRPQGSTTTAAATAFQSSDTTSTAAAGRSILPPSITQVPFSDFEKAEQSRTFLEIRDSCRGCWSGAMAVVGMEAKNKIVMKEPPVRNFRLSVETKRNSGTWTIWNLLQEGDVKVVPLRKTPPERLTQYKVAFPGMVIRIPCAITTQLPRIVFEINFWDDRTRRTSVVEYFKETNWWSSATASSSSSQQEVPWRLAETSLVQMKRQNKAGFVGPITDPRAIAFLPTRSSFHIRDWDWTLWKPVRTECVDFVGEKRNDCRLQDGSENQQAVYNRIVQAFDHKDASNFVSVLPNSMLTSMPYRLNLSSSDTSRAFFAHAFNDNHLAVVEVEYEGRVLKSTSLHSFQKK